MERPHAVLPSLSPWRGESPHRGNVGTTERMVSVAAGAALLGWGLSALVRGRALQALAGGATGVALARRGMLGRSRVYDLLGIEEDDARRFSSPLSREVHVRRSIAINAPPEELYHRWRRLEDLPKIMRHLIRVGDLGEGHSHWEARGPFGSRISWEARITSDQPGRVLAWRSLPGGEVETSGRIDFTSLPHGRGTALRVDLVYRPPAGALGAAAAKLLGADPVTEVEEDLRRFKQLVETGEVATNAMALEPGQRPGWRELQRSEGEQPRTTVAGSDWADQELPEAIDEASMESFPASDPPGWIGRRHSESERT